MSDLPSLKSRRAQIKAKVTRFNTFLDSFSREQGLTQIKIRLSKIEECYADFESVQSDIEIIANQDVQEQERQQFEDMYFDTVSRAQTLIQECTNSGTSEGRSSTSQGYVTEVKLPAIELPSFHGGYDEWLPFKDTFQSLIHNNEALSDIQKYHYLKSSLKGSAAELIHSLHVTALNYSIAWGMLQERYENKKIIVQTHVRALFDLPKVERESASQLRRLLDDVVKHLRSLQALGLPTEHWDTLLIHLLFTRLDPISQRLWESATHSDTLPSFQDMSAFLKQRYQVLEATEVNRKQVPKEQVRIPFNKTTRVNPNACLVSQIEKCKMCGNNHKLFKCFKFLKLGVEERRNRVRKWELCFNCLGKDHFSKDCKSGHCKGCDKKHNTLLHLPDVQEEESVAEPRTSNRESTQGASFTGHAITSSTTQALLATALVDVINHRGFSVTCRAMLDSGSQSHYMTESLCGKLGLRKKRVSVPVIGINGTSTHVSHTIQAQFRSRHSDYHESANFLIVPKITDHMPSSPVDPSKLLIPPDIALADPFFYNPSYVDILFGADIFWALLGPGKINTGTQRVTLRETRLGWVLTGRIEVQQPSNNTVCNLSLNNDINSQLQQFWQLEECRNERVFTGEDRACEQHYVDNFQRKKTGEYVVKLPLKGDPQLLGDSKETAQRRLFSLEKRFTKDPNLRERYSAFMQEYENLGHMEPSLDKDDVGDPVRYYLPHHPVLKESSSTTKLRVVFDASAKSDSGLSLNDILMVGPTVQEDLFSIIVRFRTHKYVLTGDIEKMYRCVKLHPSDTPLQMILWRESPDQPVKSFKLNTVTYGTASAPYLATRTLHQLADDEGGIFPQAAIVLKRDFYVDDLLTGANTIEETKTLQTQLMELLQRGGFFLRKWCTNQESILMNIPEEMRTQTTVAFNQDAPVKTLGLLWEPRADTFRYDVQKTPQKETHTKRSVLSEISQIFDPLGLIGPVILSCKIFLQELWLCKIDWDDSLPADKQKIWVELRHSLARIKDLTVPRKIISVSYPSSVQIHGFCDASVSAYGACVYLRCTDKGNNILSRLICSKSRVAPIKTQSVPRLELCGALLLSELMSKVKSALNLRIDSTFYWTDSKIVLAWLSAQSTNWNVFVANRVSKIQDLTDVNSWRHVSTHDNPADLVSRGASVSQLMESKLWWEGAPWLSEPEDTWPEITQENTLEEARGNSGKLITLAVREKDTSLIHRFSSLTRLKRVTAYCYRFIMNTRAAIEQRTTGPLTTRELHAAVKLLLRMEQDNMFPEELETLQRGLQVSKTSKMCALNPFLDQDGLLRVGGRIQNADVSEDQKHPIIIAANSHLTKLIIEDVHRKELHAGPSAVLNAVREEYWPLRGKQVVRSVIRKCISCFRLKAAPANQLMGNLPSSRVTPSRPFLHTGVDYCGPVYIRQGFRKKGILIKTYVAVFICFSTKAIHLEVVSELTTAAFLAALHRFVARRGKCSHLYSDNATNFVGARRELEELNNLVQSEKHKDLVQTTLANEGIQWHFIPARSPHVGGIWEAGVKAFKYHFRRVVGNNSLTMEELTTLTAQIEACLNSRPLTHISNDPNDPSPLTPAHFLIGSSLTAIPEPDLQMVPQNRLSRWQHLQQMLQHFWQRWSKEYLNSLQQRSKWRHRATNLKEGDLVLLKEDNSPPLSWQMGKIVALHPGADGVVRVVTLKVSNGQIKRHVNKLCPFPE